MNIHEKRQTIPLNTRKERPPTALFIRRKGRVCRGQSVTFILESGSGRSSPIIWRSPPGGNRVKIVELLDIIIKIPVIPLTGRQEQANILVMTMVGKAKRRIFRPATGLW